MINRYFNHLKQLKDAKKSSRLAIEITVILTVKIILLWLLWAAYFSQPIAKDARQLAVTRMILNHPD
ncbi:MAG: cytochrome oxidase putative small subunit CydP [Pseudomonadota bacterium]